MAEEVEREKWKSAIAGTIGVNKYGGRGERVQEVVRPGQTFSITTEERQHLNIAAEPQNDVFTNGMLVPVTLADSVEDLEEITGNPNVVTESEIKALVTGHYKTLDTALADITSGGVLTRFREVAIAENVGVKTLQRIDDRYEELDIPPTEGHYKVQAFSEKLNPVAAN